MNNKLGFLAAGLAILSGCAAPPARQLPAVILTSPTPEEADVLKRAVVSALKDPDSARFGGRIVLVNYNYACVEVNAKNSLGGYTGFQQAALAKVDENNWGVLKIANLSRDQCVDALHHVTYSK